MESIDQDDRGFTLIELMIVVVILGILAAIVVVGVSQVTQQSQSAACGIEDRTLRTAVELHKGEIGVTAALADLDLNGIDALVTAELVSDVIANHSWDAVNDEVVGIAACLP